MLRGAQFTDDDGTVAYLPMPGSKRVCCSPRLVLAAII